MKFNKAVRVAFAILPGALTSLAMGQVGPYAGHQVLRVRAQSPADVMKLNAIAIDIWNCRIGVGPLDVQVTPAGREAIRRLGLEFEVLVEDVDALFAAEAAEIREGNLNRDASWFTTYKNLADINLKLDTLAANSAGYAVSFTAGNSLEGRAIRGIRISAPDLPGNPRSARPQALFAGGIHAREWISPMSAMYIADRLTERATIEPRIAELLREVEVIVIPVQNPDGYAYTWASAANRLWRKNRRNNGNGTYGVDLNRNFGFQWGGEGASTIPGDLTYRGTGPFSEPETAVFRDFVLANPRIRTHVDLHSYGQYILTPWGYTAAPTPDALLFDRVSDEMAAAIAGVHTRTYANGPTYTLLYAASGGEKDWTYGDRGILGMTIELRDQGQYGFSLPSNQILPTAEENFEASMVLANYARRGLWLSTPDAELSNIAVPAPMDLRLLVKSARSSLGSSPPVVRWRVGSSGAFSSRPMTGGSPWIATLEPAACTPDIEWYFEALASDGSVTTLPADAPLTTFRTSPLSRRVVFSDDMETNRGWSVGASDDDATQGIWLRTNPVGTTAQPEDDASPNGTRCWVTGSGTGPTDANDIDGGRTTLTSPIIDTLPPVGFRVNTTRIECQLWYSNNTGPNPNSDVMLTEISNNGGTTWNQVAVISQNLGRWWTMSLRVEDFIAPSSQLRFRFRARDVAPDSIVEAAVDEFRVILEGCRTGDFNGDGGIDGDDVIGFFVAWDGNLFDSDYNDDGSVDGDDVIMFFELWDTGR